MSTTKDLMVRNFVARSSFTVTKTGKGYDCVKLHNGRMVTVKLKSVKDGFEISAPSYNFVNRQSYLKYNGHQSKRDVYDKNFILSVVKEFKKWDLWEHITNKDFVVVNDECTRKTFSCHDVAEIVNQQFR
jgi:hypothetical protein